MRILALVGSHRTKGNTARIVQRVEARMRELAEEGNVPLEWETLYLSDHDVHPCRGCRACFDRGEDACPLKDDVPLIRSKVDAADGLLLASPVYVGDVSGLVKTWIDRLAYLSHRPALGGKSAYTLATAGGSSTRHALRTMDVALLTWGCHLAGRAGFKMGALAAPDAMARYEPRAARVAQRLFGALSAGDALRPSFLSLVAFKVQQLSWEREPPGSYDHTYWLERGWLAPDCTFYVSHRASWLRVKLARLVGAVVHRFVA